MLRCTKLLVVVVYKPPNVHHDKLSELYDFVTLSIPVYEHIICMGDFNINLLAADSCATRKLSENNSSFSSFSLSTLPSSTTHHKPGCLPSLIDLTIVARSDKAVQYDHMPAPGVSFHDLLFLAYSVKVAKYPTQIVTYRSFKNLDLERFSVSLSEVDWTSLEAGEDLNEKVTLFNQNFLKVFDFFAPVKESRVTRAHI